MLLCPPEKFIMQEKPNNKENEVVSLDLEESSIDDGVVSSIWKKISHWGLAESVLRFGGHLLTITLILIAVIIMRSLYNAVDNERQADLIATAEVLAAPTVEAAAEELGAFGGPILLGALPLLSVQEQLLSNGIPRFAQLQTTIPTRARVSITTYEVQQGDNLFSIAGNFGLRPESILWGNPYSLQGDFRFISTGLILNILPTDGVYHQWSSGENLVAVANFYGVDPQTILDWPGNELDSYEIDADTFDIQDGAWIIIPEGTKAIVDWGPPAITRDNPAVADYYGPGSCGAIYEGAVGNGTFVWPTVNTQISGFYYNPILHPAIDIGGPAGNAVFATDSGVVVYAGLSNYGFGLLVVIDHGTGWQSAYAHLSSYNVSCGQSVFQGDAIAAVGNTGNSSGSHLHFELTSVLFGKVNPLDWVSP